MTIGTTERQKAESRESAEKKAGEKGRWIDIKRKEL
jgi:hypothetical protein